MKESFPTLSEAEHEALLAHNSPAWDDFFAKHDAVIRQTLAWRKWSFDLATQQDVAQNIRGELPKALANFDPGRNLEAFLRRLCIHRCIDELRRKIKRQQRFVVHEELAQRTANEQQGDAPDPVALIIQAERAKDLHGMIAETSETCQEAIRLFYFESLSYTEIGEALGLAVNTVGSRLSKCLTRLKEAYAEKKVKNNEDGE